LKAGELAKDFSPWMNLASTQLRRGRMVDARTAAHRARELDGDEPLPFFVLSLCARHDHDEAGARYLLAIAEQTLQRLPAEARELLEKVRFVQEARR
jgi:cytochrome c-type biogenesis protein CcmH/NrfG